MIFIYGYFRSTVDVDSDDRTQNCKSSENKKKPKKEHKRKHKKRSTEKHDKTKKHKKHKKHKRKHSESVEETSSVKHDKSERYTPEPSIPIEPVKETTPHIINGKSSSLADKESKPVEIDTDKIVSYVSAGLSNTHSLEIISSESDDAPEVECDSDAIDVSVIEADMDLEELMKQKELLQAEIAKASNDFDEEIASSSEKANKVTKVSEEVILLDDSSNDSDNIDRPKRKRSASRERRVFIDKRDTRYEDKRKRTKSKERYRNSDRVRDIDKYRDTDRYKEKERQDEDRLHIKEHSRSRDRGSIERRSKEYDRHRSRDIHRLREKASDSRDNRRNRDYDMWKSRDKYDDRDKDLLYNHRRNSFRGRLRRDYDDYKGDRSRSARYRSRDRRDKDKSRSKPDKYKDSLSEGQPTRASSSDSDELDIDINDDEEDEQKIIEKRRKQREELLKVFNLFFL